MVGREMTSGGERGPVDVEEVGGGRCSVKVHTFIFAQLFFAYLP